MASPTRSASFRSWVTKIAVIAYRAATRLKSACIWVARLDVEAAEGLVEEQERGLDDQRPAEGDALPLPSRELVGRLVALVEEIEAREHLGDVLRDSIRRATLAQAEAEGHVLEHASGAGRAAAPGRGTRRRASPPEPGRCRRRGAGSPLRRARGGRPGASGGSSCRSPIAPGRSGSGARPGRSSRPRGPSRSRRPWRARARRGTAAGAVMRWCRTARRLIHERARGGRRRRMLATAA